MRIIVFGLGLFGTSLARKLAQWNHEVIGIDKDMSKVESLKNDLTYAIQLDSTDEKAVRELPLKDIDVAIVAIGENEGASIMTTALLKKLKLKRIISRAMSDLHETVIQSMGIHEIFHPETDSAERLAQRIHLAKMLDSLDLPGEYAISEIAVPDKFIGKTVTDMQPRQRYDVNIVTILRVPLQQEKSALRVLGMVNADTEFQKGDVLVIFGEQKSIEKMLEI